jgi:alanine racemase
LTLTLTVDSARWHARVTAVAGSYRPLVPVVKGNGYGFGRAELAARAVDLLAAQPAADGPPTIAVGTVHELLPVPAGVRQLVLTPVTADGAPALAGHEAIVTVATADDVDALHGWRGQAVVKLESSMHRFGAAPAEVASVVERACVAGLVVVGASIHLPLAGDDSARLEEIEAWLPLVEPLFGSVPSLWVSHLEATAYAALTAAHARWTFPMRVGTRLWHGERSALHLSADVVGVRSIAAATTAGYHATPAPTDGSLVIVGAGSAHGVSVLDDGRSPFHFQRRRVALLEPPHMHSSTLFVPTGDPLPKTGDGIDVQRPLISVRVDRTVWT